MVTRTSARYLRTEWTGRIQWLTLVCSVVFTVCTAVQTFVFFDLPMFQDAMRLGGADESRVAAEAPGYLDSLRLVGVVYILGNAVGLLALWGKSWVFWVVFLTNVTQATGPLFMIPPEVIEAQRTHRGGGGFLMTVIVDGGGLLLAVLLIVSLVVFRAPWAQRRQRKDNAVR